MKQIYQKVAVAAALMLAPVSLWAEDISATQDGLLFTVAEGSTTATLKGLAPETETPAALVVPDVVSVDGTDYPVTVVGENAFKGNKAITSITLGKNVESVDLQAFYGCTGVTEVTLNEGLKNLGEFAFWQNKALKTISLPASLETMGANPFGECLVLTDVEVNPENTHFTNHEGGLYDKALTQLIYYPASSKDGSTIELTLPSSLKKIGANALRSCMWVTGIVMPEGLEEIGAQALYSAGVTDLSIPASVTSIGEMAFFGLSFINSFSVADGNQSYKSADGLLLTADGKQVVAGVIVPAELTIPEGVEEVCSRAFFKAKMTKLTLPASMKKAGESSFYACSKLEEIDFGTGLEEIDRMAFQQCTKLSAAKLPASLRVIGFQGFANCNMITTLELPEGLEEIGENAFYFDFNIDKVEIPGTVKNIGKGAFYSCQRVKSVVVHEGVTSIPEGCFLMCLVNESVTLPSTLVELGADAFSYNQSLPHVDLPEGLITVGDRAFTTCNLDDVVLPNSVTSIGEMAFSNNVAMKSFTCGTGLKKMGASALTNNAITELNLNEGLEEIGQAALAYLFNIEEITIPSTVTKIGSIAFAGNQVMETITNLSATPQVLTEELFDSYFDGYLIVKLAVPAGSVNAYKEAPIWSKFVTIEETKSSAISITDEATDAVPVEYYDLTGRRIDSQRPGISIVRMSDGSTRKMVIK